MSITGGFGFMFDIKSGIFKRWVVGSDCVKRWADSGEPVDEIKSNGMIDNDD